MEIQFGESMRKSMRDKYNCGESMLNEMPTITKTAGYNTVSYGAINSATHDARVDELFHGGAIAGALRAANPRLEKSFEKQFLAVARPAQAVAQQEAKPMASVNRIVKVFIVDPSIAIPADKRVLYQGSEKFTELTDQELFFEVPVNDLLAKHNEYRKTVVDKKAAEKFGRDIFLEPIRISALTMAVVDVATF